MSVVDPFYLSHLHQIPCQLRRNIPKVFIAHMTLALFGESLQKYTAYPPPPTMVTAMHMHKPFATFPAQQPMLNSINNYQYKMSQVSEFNICPLL